MKHLFGDVKRLLNNIIQYYIIQHPICFVLKFTIFNFSPHMNVFGVLTRIYLETTTASYASPTQIINAGEQLAITP